LQKPIDAPEYISQSEWHHKRAKWRRRSTAFASACAVVILGIVGAQIFGERIALSRAENGILRALDNVGRYQVATFSLAPRGVKRPLRNEVHDGDDWQLSLWGGKVFFTKHGGDYTTFEPASNTEFLQASWFGSTDYVKRLRAALVVSDPWKNGPKFFREGADVNQRPIYQIQAGDVRYLVGVDDYGRVRHVDMQRFEDKIWRPFESSDFTYRKESIVDPRTSDTKVVDLTQPDARDALFSSALQTFSLTKNRIAFLRAVSVNRSGTVFLLLDGVRNSPNSTIISSDGATYATEMSPVVMSVDSHFAPYYAVYATRVDPKPAKWPLTFKVNVSSDIRTLKGSFEIKIRGPNCTLVPEWFNSAQAADAPYFDCKRFVDKSLGDFYSRPHANQGGNAAQLAAQYSAYLTARDRGMDFELASIDDYYHMNPPQDHETNPDFMAETWYAIYRDIREISKVARHPDKDQARRALQLADNAAHNDLYHGYNRLMIDAELAAYNSDK
jgi:hypothetical protein